MADTRDTPHADFTRGCDDRKVPLARPMGADPDPIIRSR
jgi:hypothetical protein